MKNNYKTVIFDLRSMKIKWMIVLFFGLIPTLVLAQNPGTGTRLFSLAEAKEYARENNFDLKNAGKDVQIARKIVKENTSIGLPQISASVEYLDFIDRPTSLLPGDFFGQPGTEVPIQFGTKYNATAKAQLTQLIFSGQYLVGLQVANAYLELTREKIKKDEREVLDQVTTAYISVLIVEESNKILDSTLLTMRQMLNETNQIYQNGLIEDIEVEQLALNVSNLEAMVTTNATQKNLAYSYLKFLMGLSADQEISLSDNLETLLFKVNRDLLVKQPFDHTQYIDYLLLKKQERLTFLQYKLAKTAYYPTLAGFVGFQENAQRNDWNFFHTNKLWFRTTNWGVSLSIPIWSSGSRKYKVDQARLHVEKLRITEEKVKTSLQVMTETTRKDFNNSYMVFLNKKKGIETAEKIYRKTAEKYRQGVASSLELEQKYNQFLMSENDYILAAFDLLKVTVTLEKLLARY